MRPKTITVTSGSSIVPVDYKAGEISVTATPDTANYDVAYTTDNIFDSTLTIAWIDVTNMSGASTEQSQMIQGPVSAIRVTLNSGTDVTVSIIQRNY